MPLSRSRPIAILVGAVLAASALGPVSSAAAADTASISGVVRDSSSVVQSGVDVLLFAYGDPYEPATTTTTNSDGQFALTGLPAGRFQVAVVDSRMESPFGTQYWNPGTPLMSREHFISLAAGEQRTGVDTTLYRQGILTGELLCSLCDLPNFSATIEHRPAGSNAWAFAAFAETSWRSTMYQARGLLPGEYRLVVSNLGEDWRVGPVATKPFTYTEGASLEQLDVIVRPDRVIMRTSTGTIREARGNGASAFVQSKTIYAKNLGADIIADPGDFTGDGVNDVIARSTYGNLLLLRGTATGTVAAPIVLAKNFGDFKRVITPGDVTGDGNSDVLALTTAGSLYIYPGDGRGKLGARSLSGAAKSWASFGALSGAGDFVIDQFNSPDLVARSSSGSLFVFAGRGDGTFRRSTIGSGASSFTDFVAIGDFDDNYYFDFLGRTSKGSLYLFSGDGTKVWKRSLLSTSWDKYRAIG